MSKLAFIVIWLLLFAAFSYGRFYLEMNWMELFVAFLTGIGTLVFFSVTALAVADYFGFIDGLDD